MERDASRILLRNDLGGEGFSLASGTNPSDVKVLSELKNTNRYRAKEIAIQLSGYIEKLKSSTTNPPVNFNHLLFEIEIVGSSTTQVMTKRRARLITSISRRLKGVTPPADFSGWAEYLKAQLRLRQTTSVYGT